MSETNDTKADEENTITETPIPKPRPTRVRKTNDLPVIERRNWLIHQHYVRNEFGVAKKIIEEQLQETNGECEFALYVNAMICRSEGEINKSLELLQMCINMNPTNALIMKQIARNLFLLGKYKNSIECYNRSASMGGKDWEISHNMGMLYMQLKQYDQAEKCYNEALVLNKHDISFVMLAKLFIEIKSIDKAVVVLKNGITFSPENVEMLSMLGLLYLQEKKYHKAFEFLGQALTFDTENFDAILGAGSLMQSHGDYDVALAKYRVAAQKSPESASLWNNIAMCFFGKSKYVAAIACFKRAAYLAPFDWKIQYNLALIHLTMQQPASAFKFASTALTLKQNSNLYVLLGISLANLGEEENAIKSYEEALKILPENTHALINLAVHLHKSDRNSSDVENHVKELVKILQKEPNKEITDVTKKLANVLNMDVFKKQERDEKKIKQTRSKESVSKTKENSKSVKTDNQNEIKTSLDQPSKKHSHKQEKKPINDQITTNIISGASSILSSGLTPLVSPGALASLSQNKDKDLAKLLPSVPKHEPERKKTSKPLKKRAPKDLAPL